MNKLKQIVYRIQLGLVNSKIKNRGSISGELGYILDTDAKAATLYHEIVDEELKPLYSKRNSLINKMRTQVGN